MNKYLTKTVCLQASIYGGPSTSMWLIEQGWVSPRLNSFCDISHTWGCGQLCEMYVCVCVCVGVKNILSGVKSQDILKGFPTVSGRPWKSHFPTGWGSPSLQLCSAEALWGIYSGALGRAFCLNTDLTLGQWPPGTLIITLLTSCGATARISQSWGHDGKPCGSISNTLWVWDEQPWGVKVEYLSDCNDYDSSFTTLVSTACYYGPSQVAQWAKNPLAMQKRQETWVQSWVWKIPWRRK